MATIIFAIADSISHYNASYRIAGLLRAEGHSIIYVGDSRKREKEVLGQGYRFELIYQEHFAGFDERGKRTWFQRLIRPGERYRMLASYKRELVEGGEIGRLIRRFRPDLFVIDVFHILHAVSIQRYGVKTVMLQTYQSTEKDRLVPPLNSGLIPVDDRGGRKRVEWLWWKLLTRRRIFNMLYRIIYAGMDKHSLLLAVAKRSGVSRGELDHERAFHPGLRSAPELVLCAREFDFVRGEREGRYFVGPLVDMQRRDMLYDAEYLDIILERELDPERGAERPLVYCSLGTLNLSWYKHSERFFRLLISAFGAEPRYELFVSVGTDIDPAVFGPLPENVKIFRLVPQLDILERASLMITHGGINSINECILSGVPMIVYPLSSRIDQPGNAARIVYHGLGLRGDIRRETASGIMSKIDAIISDGGYRQRVSKMKKIYEGYGGGRIALQVIEGCLAAGANNKTKTNSKAYEI